MPRHHVIISGTGRAGTTFFVQLLTELGLETGFPKGQVIDTKSHGGLELDIRDANAPYVIKSPWLCDYLDDVLQGGDIVIDHAFIPMRDLYEAAQSRRHVSSAEPSNPGAVPGGLWHTSKPEEQENVLTGQLYKLMYALAKHDVPVSLLLFPRLVRDPEYLYQKTRFLFGNVGYDLFKETFQAISRPELVHNFTGAQKTDRENPVK